MVWEYTKGAVRRVAASGRRERDFIGNPFSRFDKQTRAAVCSCPMLRPVAGLSRRKGGMYGRREAHRREIGLPSQAKVLPHRSRYPSFVGWYVENEVPRLWRIWRQSQCRHQHLDGVTGAERVVPGSGTGSGRAFLVPIPLERSFAVWSSHPFFGDSWQLGFIPSTRWCLEPVRVPSILRLSRMTQCSVHRL